MNVRQLIEELEGQNPDADVAITCERSNDTAYIVASVEYRRLRIEYYGRTGKTAAVRTVVVIGPQHTLDVKRSGAHWTRRRSMLIP